jgi:hypothetical protein
VATLQNTVDQTAIIRNQMWLNQRVHSLAAVASSRKRFVLLFGLTLFSIGCLQTTSLAGELEDGDFAGDKRASTGERFADYNIVTVLPRDAISAIDNPKFVSALEANERYAEDELVLGVEFNGDARAYSIPMLSSHEIVNDTVGGVKIAVTW